MKKTRFPFYIVSIIFILVLLSFTAAASIIGVANAFDLNINESSSFDVEVTTDNKKHAYTCYPIVDIDDSNPDEDPIITDHKIIVSGVEYKTVAIKWVSYKGEGAVPSSIRVPDTVTKSSETYYVLAISKGGFMHSPFESITLPDKLEEIREGAFAYCESLESIALPYQISEIAPSTFLDCRSLETVTYKEMKNNTIVDSDTNERIVRIGDHAFDSCVSLASFSLPDSLLYIGKSSFQKCSELTQLRFPVDTGCVLYQKGVSTWAKVPNSSLRIGKGNPNASTNPVVAVVIGNNGDYYADITNKSSIVLYSCSKVNDTVTWTAVQNAVVRKMGVGHPDDNFTSSDTVNANDYYIDTNSLTIEEYAFADCGNLSSCYFEENFIRGKIEAHAFADCNSLLKFSFGSDWRNPLQQIEDCDSSNAKWREKNIRLNDDTLIPILTDYSKIYSDTKYTGLSYKIKTGYIYLDSAYNESTGQYTSSTPLAIDTTGYRYAEIDDNSYLPSTTCAGYYDVSTKFLTIPDRVYDPGNPKGEPNDDDDPTLYKTSLVKVIGPNAFSGDRDSRNQDIKRITFNEHLIQVAHKAFYHCKNLTGANALTFHANSHLKEISYCVFAAGYGNNANPANDKTWISGVTALSLPNSLEYLGDMALTNFNNVNSISLSSSLKVIGERAFANLGYNKTGTINLTLPNSLNDAAALEANYYHSEKGQDYAVPVAIGRHCFDCARSLATVEMAAADPEQEYIYQNGQPTSTLNTSYVCSLGTSCFIRCPYLLRFKASENLWTLGASCFKDDTKAVDGIASIREVFLTSKKANALANSAPTGKDYRYPWGINNLKTGTADPIFVGVGVRNDLVVYVNDAIPGSLAEGNANEKDEGWNVERGDSYINELQTSSRSRIPTYANVPWDEDGGILYWKPGVSGNGQFVSAPNNKTQYDAGVITLVKDSSDNYIVARYYCDDTNAKNVVDLSSIPTSNATYNNVTYEKGSISDDIKTIGEEAFGYTNFSTKAGAVKVANGRVIILPSAVATISERAFYRNATKGVNIVTYRNTDGRIVNKSGGYFGSIIREDPNDNTSDIDVDATAAASDTLFYTSTDQNNPSYISYDGDSTHPYYCCLPSSVRYIGRNAFYNNNFASVNLTIASTAVDTNSEFGFYIGNSAFYTHAAISSITSFTITDNRTGSNKKFETSSNGGFYYLYDYQEVDSVLTPQKKILLYQPMSSAAVGSRTLNIDSKTVAIGMHALANTNYEEINIPSSVTTLYGGAFQANSDLTTITGGSGIKYISAIEPNQTLYSEIWQSSMPFDIVDWWKWKNKNYEHYASRRFAFKDCTSLETLDLKSMENLERIGRGAFENCSALNDMTGGTDTYYYCVYDSTTGLIGAPTAKQTGVMDLRETNIKAISATAFHGCSGIEYVHLPDTTNGDRTKESKLFIGKAGGGVVQSMPGGHTSTSDGTDQDGSVFNNASLKVLLGENVYQARENNGNTIKCKTHYYFKSAKATENWWGTADKNVPHYNIKCPLTKNSSGIYTDLYSSEPNHRYWIEIPVKVKVNEVVYERDYCILLDSYSSARSLCDILYSDNPNSFLGTQTDGYPCIDTTKITLK